MKNTFLITLVFTLTTFWSYAQDSWNLLNPTPTFRTGVDIHFMSPEHGYILTQNFQVLETIDAGENWTVKHTFEDFSPMTDFAFHNSLGFIVGDDGNVLKTTDGGATWVENIDIGIEQNLNSVHLFDQTIIISGENKLAKSIDGGSTWEILDIPELAVTSTYFISELIGHASCKFGKILKTIDGGLSWYITEESVATNKDFLKVYFFNEQIGYAARENNKLFKTEDGGETWIEVLDLDNDFYTLNFVNENVGYAAGDRGAMYKTIDGGLTWEWASPLAYTNDFSSLYGLHFFDENTGIAIGHRGRIAKTTDGGQTWTDYSPTYHHIDQIDFPSPEIGFVLGAYEILKTTDTGITWENLGRPLADNKTEVFHFVNENIGYVIVGGSSLSDFSGYVYKTIDGGLNWLPTNNGNPLEETIDLMSIYFINENIGYASGFGFTIEDSIYKTTDGGDSWIKVGEEKCSHIYFITETIGYGFSFPNSKLLKTTDGGVTWEEELDTEEIIFDFHFLDENIGYIAGNSFIYKTVNGGNSWEQLNGVPNTTIESVEFINNDFGYLSTGSKIYWTEDGGQTWEFSVQAPDNIRDICTTAEKVYLVGTIGTIMTTSHNVVSNLDDIAENDLKVTIAPNPSTGFLSIKNEGPHKITSIAVFDITGKEIQITSQINDPTNIQLTLPQATRGLFFVKVTLDNNLVITKKLVSN